jgi:hypothetical protein
MNTLVYKRTHTGDPNTQGVFGCHDCMGQIRRRSFDAVIGVGGKRPDQGHEGIAFKIRTTEHRAGPNEPGGDLGVQVRLCASEHVAVRALNSDGVACCAG